MKIFYKQLFLNKFYRQLILTLILYWLIKPMKFTFLTNF
ncbi:hypothetical protein PLIP_b0591 [Pseudoalteromonas lipolytica LMEB 39]|nr:hypothetical protein [Pseudoalteromonas lipolytica LMEB 39]